MAIRVRILFTLGLLLLNGSILSVQTYVNNVVSETPLKFSNLTLNNPRNVLAADDTPIYLHCQVFTSISDDIKYDFQTQKDFYSLTQDDTERDDENDLSYTNDYVKQFYDAQSKRLDKKTILKTFNVTYSTPSLKSNDIKTNENNDDDEDYDGDDQGKPRSKRDTHDYFSYEWMKNDKIVLSFNYSSGDEPITRDGYTLFSNGTFKFVPSTLKIGVYRCKVKFTYLDEYVKKKVQNSNREFEIGPILSQATVVESSETRSILMSAPVMSRSRDDSNEEEKASLTKVHKIKSGTTIELSCVSNWRGEKISWTFMPRRGNRSVSLPESSNELKIVSASLEKHDGFYNCSIGSNQTLELIVMTLPTMLNVQHSMVTEVSATMKLNCNTTGNPMPTLHWYRNGEPIVDSPIKYASFPSLRILSVEPFDDGFYQCFARNDYGEASTTFFLHVRPRNLLNYPPFEPKCHSTDDGNLKVTFNRQSDDKFSSISYLASYDKFDFDSGFSIIFENENNFTITRSVLRGAKMLKPFYLYMRFMLSAGKSITLSLLSNPVTCAFQQIEPRFIKASNGSFLGWNLNVPREDLSKTIITIQFLKNTSTDALSFTNEVVGSYEKINESTTWTDVERSLQKIAVNSSDHGNFTEIKVAGNVTGILIIKVEEISVRVFGSIEENGTHIRQDYEHGKWNVLKSPYEALTVSDIQARSISISWNGLESFQCLLACTYLNSPIFIREKSTKLNCEKINNPSAKSFYINKLSPTSDYDVFITDCERNNELSTRVNIQTMRDVPGPILEPSMSWDRGFVLKWNEPKNPNGIIFYYTIEWTLHDITHSSNVTERYFKFPNTITTDRLNITVRAIGEGGVGNPLHVYPDRWKNVASKNAQSTKFDPFMIFGIIVISIVLVLCVVGLILCKQNRYCKNNSNAIINSEQSSFSPTSPCMENNMIRNDEIFEMQTLIPSNNIANGKDNPIKTEMPSVNGVCIDRILRTSTPTDDLISAVPIQLPPVKCDKITSNQIDGTIKKSLDIVPLSHILITPVPNKTLQLSVTLKNPLKVNGNSSPYKSLQSSGNDQNTSSSTSSTSSFSSGHYIDISMPVSVCNNNNHHHGKAVGKSSSIETDNDEDDSELMHEYGLNDSNLSTKPLHSHSWNFRPTLVGPNG